MILVFHLSWRKALLIALVVFALVMSIITHKAHAEALPPEDQRTASWYAGHPAFMARLLRACRNDPGHAALNADCINAKHGEMVQAETLARQRLNLPMVLSPADPRYWFAHPADLPSRLDQCARHPPAPTEVHAAWCAAARTASNQSASR